jgi:UDP-N-acetylglucosamine 2-epimerase (hydrolysing)
MIDNSSAGILEAPYYGIPVINIGSRQQNRALNVDIINSDYTKKEILESISLASVSRFEKEDLFGQGNSDQLFLKSLLGEDFWSINKQRQFMDIIPSS